MAPDPIVSTGRGGAGNIGPDSHTYADGGIVREGIQGESLDPAFSTGRGGAGNVSKSPNLRPQEGLRGSQDIIPETALREGHQENYHTGRGGGGNVHKEKYGGHTHDPNKESILDKAKHALHLDKDKKTETSASESAE
ncbi:hypothetical protein K469DRAFT_704659 [Zopfia rhizophila CBS 207.26]|uniref:Uncharacterized protein n=1 Tax=Zopfia rhizophila CBS 207.26 TaxID=1314779 RepID=A0A6A6E9B2_9PEZI|nr:hypothetical protein K469DRAFT_704659 [Zopfia rhizophila CBS 207.26]